jgi:ribosomal-protein-alanine N-acetyltransferase
MKIRRFALSDLPRIVHIERISFGPDSYTLATFLAHVLRDRRGLLVAEGDEGEVVGYALVRTTLGWLGGKRGGITSIAVDPARRRQGVGHSLMTGALQHLQANGVKEADLEVGVDNRAAQSLYEAFGFRHARVLPHYYGANRDGIRMTVDTGRVSAMQNRTDPSRVGRAPNG